MSVDEKVHKLIDVCNQAISEIQEHHLPHLPYEYTKHLDPTELREILFAYQSQRFDFNSFAQKVAEERPDLLWPAITGYLKEGYYIQDGVLKQRSKDYE